MLDTQLRVPLIDWFHYNLHFLFPLTTCQEHIVFRRLVRILLRELLAEGRVAEAGPITNAARERDISIV